MSALTSYDERQVLLRIAAGEENAFTELFNAYVPRLMPFAQKLTKDEEAAREIIQETFLRIWLSRDQLESIDNPAGWIFTIAARQCYKFLRRKNNITPPGEYEASTPHALSLQELRQIVQQGVEGMSEQRKKVFLLSREQGLTILEIAEQLNLSPNTVKNTLVTALQQLREHLRAHGYVFPIVVLFILLI